MEVDTEHIIGNQSVGQLACAEIIPIDSQLSPRSTIEAEVKGELIEDNSVQETQPMTQDDSTFSQHLKTDLQAIETATKKRNREPRSVEKRALELGISLPRTPAICWEPGESIDVQEKDGKWYLAKIISVDLRHFRVRVHFVNWSTRFDQQLSLDSDRLRPASRHSTRRENTNATKRLTLGNFKVGDHVIAKWTDCKKYPATIASIANNDTCEIIFYDGFRRSGVTEANMELMSDELKAKYQSKALMTGVVNSPQHIKQESPSASRTKMITSRRPSALRAREISSKLAAKSKGSNESKVSSPVPVNVIAPSGTGESGEPSEPYWKDGKWHAPKEFIVTNDHNPFKCTVTDCSKSFRKGSLLESHIKYYHPTLSGRSGATPRSNSAVPRTAPLTQRITSTSFRPNPAVSRNKKDSNIEVPSPNPGVHAAKRRRFISTGAEALSLDTQVKSPATSLDSTEGECHSPSHIFDKRRSSDKFRRSREKSGCSEASDEDDDEYLEKDGKFVNCICSRRSEHNVIQCTVCRSWQHARCVQISESRVPKSYTCPLCVDPKGCRPSALYTHDQTWWLSGQLPKFSFTSPSTAHRATERVRLTHLLRSRALHIQSALHAHRSLLYAVRKNKDQELCLWDNSPARSSTESKLDAYSHRDMHSKAVTGDQMPSDSPDIEVTDCLNCGDVSHSNHQSSDLGHGVRMQKEKTCQADIPDVMFDWKLNLMSHVTREQDEVDKQLDSLEDQIAWLEAVVDSRKLDANVNPLADFSLVKQTTHRILNDVDKVDEMAEFSISN